MSRANGRANVRPMTGSAKPIATNIALNRRDRDRRRNAITASTQNFYEGNNTAAFPVFSAVTNRDLE